MNRQRRVVIAGSTFGAMYARAVSTMPHVDLVGILGRGSQRSTALAQQCEVPLFTSPAQVPDDVDLVCVVVRSGGVGGSGTQLATSLLERGISVLHELPVGQADARTLVRAARAGGASITIADLYRWLPAVQAFRNAAHELLAHEDALAIEASLSIQPAQTLARMLLDLGINSRPVDMTVTGSLVNGTLGSTPVTVRYATVLDDRDTDNNVRFPSMSIHTGSGTLCLRDVHGPVLWTPTLHLPEGLCSDPQMSAADTMIDSTTMALYEQPTTTGAALRDLWPVAIAQQIDQALTQATHGGMTATHAQQVLAVASLWTALSSGLAFPPSVPAVDLQARRALAERMSAAARQGSVVEKEPYSLTTASERGVRL
ncbi:Oxidoreductase (NAD-binding), involved in siderophore biosynthesis [Dermatophilus congolensis]|uniref:Oxidoreductase (NAD-binding), involved in siderophore biosynthesis n=1 Tax=Dermatophilus congolensis TaxID=1863 RepID=A0A239VK64_9MICO|nr:Gfo/Idh/MocA family oxidoreductase [Dermatophilus congolensis]SNV22637.1 Oxidoreductase (NAD-binding), involved in siderophore biosynthesis [Dermatophilus congolensis]